MQRTPITNPLAPAAPRDFTAILVTPEHPDYQVVRQRHSPNYGGATTLNIIAFAWVNATRRRDDSPFAPGHIGMSVISMVNEDGSTTPVTTVVGAGSSTTADAPPQTGTYKYQVAQADTAGIIGEPVDALEPVVVEKTWPGGSGETGSGQTGNEVVRELESPATDPAHRNPVEAVPVEVEEPIPAELMRKGEIIDTRGKQVTAAPETSAMPTPAVATKRASVSERRTTR